MKVYITYELESAMGTKVRNTVVARDDAELTEYVRRLAKSGYDVISVMHIR